MDAEFWHQRWQENRIGFHQGDTNALMAKHFNDLCLEKGSRVFVPLCGKTRDIAWLIAQGFRIVGAELSETAVVQLFAELSIEPHLSHDEKYTRYSATGIDIFVGDMFDLTKSVLGPVDTVYDRAALVALPEAMRQRYIMHVLEISHAAPQFLLCFEYDQNEMNGPPFSITGDEVHRYYDVHYEVTEAATVDVAGGLKGICAATETAWLLRTVPST